jgi:hypothetical protein
MYYYSIALDVGVDRIGSISFAGFIQYSCNIGSFYSRGPVSAYSKIEYLKCVNTVGSKTLYTPTESFEV